MTVSIADAPKPDEIVVIMARQTVVGSIRLRASSAIANAPRRKISAGCPFKAQHRVQRFGGPYPRLIGGAHRRSFARAHILLPLVTLAHNCGQHAERSDL